MDTTTRKYMLPGGLAHHGESHIDALRRIILSECCFQAKSHESLVHNALASQEKIVTISGQLQKKGTITDIKLFLLHVPFSKFSGETPFNFKRKHNMIGNVAGWRRLGSIAPKLPSATHTQLLNQILSRPRQKKFSPPTQIIPISPPHEEARSTSQKIKSSMVFQNTPVGQHRLSLTDPSTPTLSSHKAPVLFDIFSGTGSFGSVMAAEYGWTVYSIDICPKSAKRSKGVCADVTTFDWSQWPTTCDLLVLTPPCTPWSNATPRTRRLSSEMVTLGKLCQFAVSLISRFRPRGFIFENPRYTSLAKQKYMKPFKFEYFDMCRYNRPYMKSSVMWHSDSINLKLKTCICTGPHKVKLGRNYGGTPGCKRWSKKHHKGSIPPELVRSIADQITAQWGLKQPQTSASTRQVSNSSTNNRTRFLLSPQAQGMIIGAKVTLKLIEMNNPTLKIPENFLPKMEQTIAVKYGTRITDAPKVKNITNKDAQKPPQSRGVLMGVAFVVATPDSGSTRTVITRGTADQVIQTNKLGSHPELPGLKLVDVPQYYIDLADGKLVSCTQHAIADITVVTPTTHALLRNVTMNVLPGPISPVLIGRSELLSLQIPDLWDLIEKSCQNKGSPSPKRARQTAFKASDPLQGWRDRRAELVKGEDDSLASLDNLYAQGADEPSPSALKAAVEDILVRAKTAGAPPSFLTKLRELIMVKHYDVWRLILGKDPPARLIPMKIDLNEKLFPKNIQPRSYGPEQTAFLKKSIKRMLKAGIIVRSTSPYACCPFCPYKRSGDLRLCLDSRPANKVSTQLRFPIPNMSMMVQSLHGSKFFASLDGVEGYFQAPLDPNSYDYAAMVTDSIYSFTRITMGQSSSAGWFQHMMQRVLEGNMEPVTHLDSQKQALQRLPSNIRNSPLTNLFKDGVLQYLDDALVHSDSTDVLLVRLDRYFTRMRKFGIYLKPTKAVLYSQRCRFLGWLVQADGVSVDPEKRAALGRIPLPTTAGELQHWLSSLLFLKSKLPRFNEITSILQDKLNECLKGTSRKKRQASKIMLKSHGWSKQHTKAFFDSKIMLQKAIMTAHVDPDKHLCLFCDASALHYGACLTQIPQEDIDKPVKEQRHEPVEFLSGTFRGASMSWAINCKECFSVYQGMKKFRNYLLRPRLFTCFVDHANLRFLFDPSLTRIKQTVSTMDRLTRWSWEIQALPFKLRVIKSYENTVADLLSRWGSGIKNPPRDTACASLVTTTPQDHNAAATPVRVLANTTRSTQAKKRNPSSAWEIPRAYEWPSREDIITSQQSLTSKERTNAHKGPRGMWFKNSKILIPDSDSDLQTRICIVGHAGAAGHRGGKPTTAAIKSQFTWTNLPRKVSIFMNNCLQCLKTRSGKCQPLMFGRQLAPDGPGDVLHIDHMYIQKGSESGAKYVLVIKCGWSHLCRIIPTVSTDTAPIVSALVSWVATHGIPSAIISDGPPTMKCKLLKELTSALGIRHHIILPYTPWTNGSIERHNREILHVFRTILSQSGPSWGLERWPELCPLVQYTLNTTPCETLGGISPLEAFCGRRPKSTIDLLAFNGYDLPEIDTCKIPIDRIKQHVETLRTAIAKSGSRMLDVKHHKSIRNNKGRTPIRQANLHIGDYVLLARSRPKQSKLQCSWTGPYVLVNPVSKFIWSLRALDDRTVRTAHVQRIKRYSDSSLNRTRALNLEAQNELDQFEVEKFLKWRFNPDDQRIELKCRWLGLTDAWDTFEEVERHLWEFKDIRNNIIEYLTKHQNTHKEIRSLLGRLRGKHKASRKHFSHDIASSPAIYNRIEGGWIVKELGTRRIFNTRKRAQDALRKHKRESAKASGLQGLGGGVAVVLPTTPPTIDKTYQPLFFSRYSQFFSRYSHLQKRHHKNQDQEHTYLTQHRRLLRFLSLETDFNKLQNVSKNITQNQDPWNYQSSTICNSPWQQENSEWQHKLKHPSCTELNYAKTGYCLKSKISAKSPNHRTWYQAPKKSETYKTSHRNEQIKNNFWTNQKSSRMKKHACSLRKYFYKKTEILFLQVSKSQANKTLQQMLKVSKTQDPRRPSQEDKTLVLVIDCSTRN